MGKIMKRVPMDFTWPICATWEGYVDPYWERRQECAWCSSSGYSPAAKLISDQWYGDAPFDPAAYGALPLTLEHPQLQSVARRNVESSPSLCGRGDFAVREEARRLFMHWRSQWCHHLIQADVDALVAADRLWDFTRVPRTETQREVVRQKVAAGKNTWLPTSNGYVPTAEEVNTWSLGDRGHDVTNRAICVRTRCEREGVSIACSVCRGGGVWLSAEDKTLHEAWEPSEPPNGDGFQLWSTTFDGPVSPVFATLDALCAWSADNATTFGEDRATAQQWRDMLSEGLAYH